MQWKLVALVSIAFSAGMAFMAACNGSSGIPGVSNANADAASDCTQWDVKSENIADGYAMQASWTPPAGWEPFAMGGTWLMERRCAD